MEVSREALALVVLLIFALGLMFALVFRWMQRAEQTTYLGTLYQNSVLQLEKNRLCQVVEQEHSQGGDERDAIFENPWTREPPRICLQLDKLIEEHRRASDGVSKRPGSYVPPYGGTGGLGGSWNTPPPGLLGRVSEKPELPYLFVESADADAQHLIDEYNQEVEVYNKALREWKSAIKQAEEKTYWKKMAEATGKAKDLATKAADVDIAVFRGRGPEFVLEFTAIVVIIFSAVILGILGILKENQIGTLLAAIAGYVLGKATSQATQSTQNVEGAEAARRTEKVAEEAKNIAAQAAEAARRTEKVAQDAKDKAAKAAEG